MAGIQRKGDLCEVLPGRAIGGDRFSNRERKLPERADRQWFEADVNYRCGHREADRLVYSSDGLVFLSTDHYRTFKPVQ
ncbi:guanyl-specific ribonuclease Sa [Pantoea ananatis]|nr:guanyl-specific ribonuclease Sa [Pantoea ananatis]